MRQYVPVPARTVLIVTSSYPKHEGEPSGIFLHHLSRQLVAVGWRVLVLAPNFPGGQPVQMLDGVEIRRFNYFIPQRQALCYRSGMLPNLKQSQLLWFQVPFYLANLFVRSCGPFARSLLTSSMPIGLCRKASSCAWYKVSRLCRLC